MAECAAVLFILWHCLRHQGPKLRRVVKVPQVAELVDYDVGLQVWRQKDDAIVKVEVAQG